MGFRCSLFGHDYAEYDVERERTDHGEEVVTTVRTFERCRRCGDTRVVAENTEVTTALTRTDEQGDNGTETASSRSGPAENPPVSGRTAEPERAASNGADVRVGESGFDPPASEATMRSLAESELQCRVCEFAEDALGSSLRAGDNCPSCGGGYLVQTRKR